MFHKRSPKIVFAIYSIISNYRFLSIITATFPGKTRLASYIAANDAGGGGDNWSYKSYKAPVKLSPLTNQHPAFYRPDALPVSQPTAAMFIKLTLFFPIEISQPLLNPL